MASMLQFTACFCVCWLIRGVITQPNNKTADDKRLPNKHSNQNNPDTEDFYFDEQGAKNDHVKTGRAIPGSAWSKEENEQTQPVENKNGTQINDEFGIKKFLSYILNTVYELKKEIFGIKEMVEPKNITESINSQDKDKQNEKEGNNKAPKSGDSPRNSEFKSGNKQLRTNYLTDYYQKNGITFIDDEEEDELENSSDQSDDSSHNFNEEVNMQEDKNNENECHFNCKKMKRKPGGYSFEAEKITDIPTSKSEVKEFDNSKENGKDGDFKKPTTKPSKTELNNPKASRKKTENMTTAAPGSKIGKCIKRNNGKSVNNPKNKNKLTDKPLKYVEHVKTYRPTYENFDKETFKRPNQNKTSENLSELTSRSSHLNPEKTLKNKNDSDFDNTSGILMQPTTLSSLNSEDVNYAENMENENKPYTSKMFSEKPMYRKQQEQITVPKPEELKPKRTDKENEYTSVFSQSHKAGVEILNQKMSTEPYNPHIQMNTNFKDFKGKRSNVISTHTTIIYNENKPNSKLHEQQTASSFDIDNPTVSTTSGNIMKTNDLNNITLDKFIDKNRKNKNDESEKSDDKSDSESQGDNETEQSNDDSEAEKSLKNKTNDSQSENNNKEEDDNVSSNVTKTSDLHTLQNSIGEIQNYDVDGFDKLQEQEQNYEYLNNKDIMHEISPDQEFEYENDKDDFDIPDDFANIQDLNQNQESKLNISNLIY